MSSELSTPKGLRDLIDVDEEVDDELQKIADEKGVILLAFIGSYVPRRYDPVRSRSATIDIVDEFGTEEVLTEIVKRTEGFEKRDVYFLVNSLGGSLSSSFKTALSIRDTFDHITVFVPHIAASGGTLLALTGNKIIMGTMSQLSPVDPQVQYKNQNQIVSVNSLLRAKKKLDEIFSKKSEKELPYTDRLMAESLDPVIYEEFFGITNAGLMYLSTILEKSGYDEDTADKIANALMFTLPTHGFVIDLELAEQIGISVVSYSACPDVWAKMRKWFAKYVSAETDQHFIRYCIPKTKKP